MNPYKPATIYHDSMQVMELENWQSNGVIVQTFGDMDTVDLIPCANAIDDGVAGLNRLGPAAAMPVPFYILVWTFEARGFTFGLAAETKAVFVVEAAPGHTLAATGPDHYVIPLIGEPAVINWDAAGLAEQPRGVLSGRLEIRARRMLCKFCMKGPAPTSFRFGAYLRPF